MISSGWNPENHGAQVLDPGGVAGNGVEARVPAGRLAVLGGGGPRMRIAATRFVLVSARQAERPALEAQAGGAGVAVGSLLQDAIREPARLGAFPPLSSRRDRGSSGWKPKAPGAPPASTCAR